MSHQCFHQNRLGGFLAGVLLCLGLLFSGSLEGQTVALNEIMASNGSARADRDGDYEDWIELHNYGQAPVNLAGYGFSDRREDPLRWIFPDVAIRPGEFLLVWASGKDRRDPRRELHTNFSIRAAGERLLLSRPDGSILDEFHPAAIPRDQSMGRAPDGTGEWFYFAEPTPAAPNRTTAYTGLLAPPRLSLAAGFYDSAREVTASHDRAGVVIRYTLDGSEPSSGSPPFPNSLRVDARVGQPNVVSSIKTTAGGDFWRNPNYDVFKATTLRVRAFSNEGELPSRTVTQTYFVGEGIAERHSLPVLSIVTDRDNFFGREKGIYVAGAGYDGDWQNSNYWKRGRAWERQAHLELFEADGNLGLAREVGTRIHGGWSRRWAFKSLRFYARGDEGENEFNYPLFPDQPYESYKRFIIRNSGNDHEFTLFRDAFMQRLVGHMRFDTQAYRPAIVFINGEYWGIQNMRERYDAHYLHRVYGVDPDNLDLMQGDRVVKQGDRNHYNEMLQYIRTHPLSEPRNYEGVERRMDVDNFIDYNIAQIFLNNTDWPGNNIDFWRLRTDEYVEGAPPGHDGRWRWMLFDTDFGFWQYDGNQHNASHNAMAFATAPGGSSWPNPDWSTFLLRSLLQNETFRHAFINRFADQLNSAFLPQRAISMIDEMAAAIEPEIDGHTRRFGRPGSVNSWRGHVARMREFASQRGNYQLVHLRSHFRLSGIYALTLDVQNAGQGSFRVNSITLNENSPGLESVSFPWNGRYLQEVPLEIEAIPSPGHRFVRWLELEPEARRTITITPRQARVSLTAVFEPVAAELQFDEAPAAAQSGQSLPPFQVTASSENGFEGEVTLFLEGDGFLTGTLTRPLEGGRARFEDVVIHGAGLFTLRAEAGDCEPVVSGPIRMVRLSEVILPRYMQGEQPENFNRVPLPFRLRFEGLLPNAIYRYANRLVIEGEDPDQDGAGNMLFVREPGPFLRNTDSPSFRSSQSGLRHHTFSTDEEGQFTGWFISEPTGNWRIAPGTDLRMRILLNDGRGGEKLGHSLTSRNGIRVLEFGSGPDQASAIYGQLSPDTGGFVFLYDNETGTGRPVAGAVIEPIGAALDARYAGFYLELVAGRNGRFGSLLPNTLPAGLHRLEVRRLTDGALSAVHLFPQSHRGTVNPANALDPLAIESGEPAPLQPLPFQEWLRLKGLTTEDLNNPEIGGPDCDPDRDGISNIIEYALEGDPLIPNRATRPYLELEGDSPAIVFPRNRAKNNLAWIIQASSDLEDWSEILYDSRADPRENNFGSLMRIEDTFPRTLAPEQGRFFRLNVILLK